MKKHLALFVLLTCSISYAYRDTETGTFLTRDPIGFEDGVNQYCYVHANPITHFDALGLDTAVIFGAPQGNNPFGHIALATTGEGVYSPGTVHEFGSSLTDYLKDQSEYRNSIVYVLPSTKEQDTKTIDGFKAAAEKGQSATKNNCADITGAGLKAGGLINQRAALTFPNLINGYMLRRLAEKKVSAVVVVPKGSSKNKGDWKVLEDILKPFNKKKSPLSNSATDNSQSSTPATTTPAKPTSQKTEETAPATTPEHTTTTALTDSEKKPETKPATQTPLPEDE